MLPIPLSFAFCLQFLVLSAQTAVSALQAAHAPSQALETRLLVADGVSLALFLLAAIFQRHVFDRERARTFFGAQQVIEDRIKLEMEREQQEQLLLSVIPAYIAAEVRRRIMLRMTDDLKTTDDDPRRQQESSHKQRFHELYVQRHNNVR